MTRIIAGTAGGRTLRTPPGSGTRPTSDRVREALFSALASRDVIDGARVLDLYAGSGALGLEAASRGAAEVDLVESDRRAASVIRDNIAVLGLDGARTRAMTVATFLAGPSPAAYDLVLLDPPYDLAETEVTTVLATLAERGWTREGSLVVVERSTRSPEPRWPAAWSVGKARRYGETTLWLATC
jgi:16S rRNA (guanine966-N2)-methyltransferase